MIPKIIHYCWFGKNPKSKSVLKCIDSWKKYCPDYEIVEWNEDNFDINSNLYCKQAYEAKKWAFATDYARLVIVYNNGGVYLDTDVEIIKPIDDLLKCDCFIGRQQGNQVNTGAGFGACKNHPLIKIMMDDYENIPFIKENGEMDLYTCPHRNSEWLFKNGLNNDNSYQEICGACIFPIEYFSPKDPWTRELKVTKNTYAIHHCGASWNENENKAEHTKRYLRAKLNNTIDFVKHSPNRILIGCLGEKKYTELKQRIKRRK
ncbi:MAG: glycosyltransferase [Ruminococcus sp.]|nr:glycosyltransferase [Ruminococcus sp.]